MKRGSDRLRWRLLPWLALLLLPLFSCATGQLREAGEGGVAVWPLDDLTQGALGIDIGELLSAQVVEVLKGKGERVVERAQLVRTLEELRVGSSALADESTRLQVGRIIGARRMVFGGLLLIGGRLRIDLRAVDVESGRILKTAAETAEPGDPPQWLEAARRAAAKL